MKKKRSLNISEYLKKRNVKRFSIFIAIAFLFLIISKLSNDYKQTIKLKMDLTNVEDEIILQNDSLNTIDVLVEAKGFALVPYLFKNHKTITLDASSDVVSMSDKYVFDVQKQKFLIEGQLGTSYKVLSIKPDTLLLPYSKRASKYVPVVLEKEIDFAPGYDILNGYKLSVDSVKVVGSLDKVDAVEYISTESLVLKDIKHNIDQSINFKAPISIEVFPNELSVQAEVKRFTEGTIESSVTIINKPANTEINYFPKRVSITYYVDLDNFKKVSSEDFIVECDYTSISENQAFFIPKIVKKPESVKRASLKQKRIDFIKL